MKINEIFYSLQGEGFWAGTPATFIRFSGCNLRCSFCDTTHEKGQHMSEEEIAAAVAHNPAKHVVITGGEPSLVLTESLVNRLHQMKKYVSVETNGTHALPPNVDWITLSPKDAFEENAHPVLTTCNELKVVYTGEPLLDYSHIRAEHRFLQPCDTGDTEKNRKIMAETIEYCKANPQWRLSLQTHKITHIR